MSLLPVSTSGQTAASMPPELVVRQLPPSQKAQLPALTDESVWAGASAVNLDAPLSRSRSGEVLEEGGRARFLWDAEFFYVRFDFQDTDLVATGDKHGQKHYSLGDVAEVFLKPEDDTWYAEVHVTPAGHVSTYWYPGRGRLGLAEDAQFFTPSHIRQAVQLRGTLNNWKDRDEGWTATVAIPWKQLRWDGRLVPENHSWRVLVARYNYGRYRKAASGPELSSWPQVTVPSFHLLEEFSLVRLSKQGERN